MRGSWLAGILSVGVAAGAACSEDDPRRPPTSTNGTGGSTPTATTAAGPGGSSTGDPVADYCNAISRAYCEAAHACCTDPQALDAEFGGDVDTCIALGREECPHQTLEGVEDAIANGDATLDQVHLDRCIDRLDTLRMEGPTCTIAPYVAIVLCRAIFVGAGEGGDTCEAGYDCRSGFCLNNTCYDFLGEGEECISTLTEVCDVTQDLHCDTNGSGLCRAALPSFGACTQDFDCQSKVCDNGACAPIMPTEHCDPG